VHAKVGDGYQGWPEHAPFDKIIVTCSPEKVPPKLVEQLREGGRMLVPVGERFEQVLYLFTKKNGELTRDTLLPVLFVPMTGRAEEGRVVQPDPANPSLGNGGFEQFHPAPVDPDAAKQEGEEKPPEMIPDGWYYQRQLKLVEAADAPEGKHYVTFSNTSPGRGAQALEGMPVDGRKVKELKVTLWVKGKNIQAGSTNEQLPAVGVMFFDADRAQIGYTWVGPWRETFDWQRVSDKIRVPPKAREAIVRIGLLGATGEVSFDDLRVQKVEE
jgi:protein-L-isoaspartate(D-aspartate) O-methyltransferase